MFGQRIQKAAGFGAVGSATLFAAVTDTRFHLQIGVIGIAVATGTGILTIMETNSTGSDSAVLTGVSVSNNAGLLFFNFGEYGISASDEGSRLAYNISAGSSTGYITVTGYRR